MFREGAKAYLDKGESKTIIKNTLIQVSQGMIVIPSEIRQQLDVENSMNMQGGSTLTTEERQILIDYSSGYGLKEIAYKRGKSLSFVGGKVQKVRSRLGARNMPELIKLLFIQKEL
ncbi:MAG: hypothetical protein ABIJ04_00190 [Bacteroidota bacterium]